VFHRLPRWFQKYVPANHGFLWAPDVIYFHNRYWLYYAVSTFGAHVSAIGLASNRTLDPLDPLYHWKDCGIVISSNQATSFNAIDPSVIRTPNGKMWMSFGSFFSGIKLVQLNARTGRLLHPRHPHIYSLAKHHTIEASELYHHGHWYYLFLNWGYCCRGVHSTYNIRVGRSRRITGPYRDRRGREMMQGGGSLFLGSIGPFIGPGQSGIFDDHGKYLFTCHFYNGLRDGLSQLAVMRLAFGSSGWPELILNHP
jgi:arabinan endo-1,5-alpha-L-arabinosidase